MNRQSVAETIPIRGPLPVVLELMRALAISVLGEHIDEARAVRGVWLGLAL